MSVVPSSQWRKVQHGGGGGDLPDESTPFVSSCQLCSSGVVGTYLEYDTLGKHDIEAWPSSTGVACWNDGATFTGPPMTLPFGYDDIRGTFEVAGVFCSTACAQRYAMDHFGHRTGLIMMWMHHLHKLLFPGTPYHAHGAMAPPRNTLVRYGGHLTLKEYRGDRTLRGAAVELLTRPLVSYPIVAHMTPTRGNMGTVTGLRRPSKSKKDGGCGGGGGGERNTSGSSSSSSRNETATTLATEHSGRAAPP